MGGLTLVLLWTGTVLFLLTYGVVKSVRDFPPRRKM